MAKVSIQIITWNSLRFIFDCLESLMRQSYRDFSILIIDNGSDDGTVEFIRSQYPTVSVLQNFKNLGFAKANNQGIQLAKGDYVLVMNPDVILDNDFLQQLVIFADQHLLGVLVNHQRHTGLEVEVVNGVVQTCQLTKRRFCRPDHRDSSCFALACDKFFGDSALGHHRRLFMLADLCFMCFLCFGGGSVNRGNQSKPTQQAQKTNQTPHFFTE